MITEQQTKFIELRARGFSLSSIAADLNVSKRTLVNWGHKLEAEIQDLHTVEQEALQEQILGLREQRLRRQGELLAQVEAELQKRSLADLSTARLYSMAESIRKQILKETAPTSRPHPVREVQNNHPSAMSLQPTSGEGGSRRSSKASCDGGLPSAALAPLPTEDRCNNGAISVQQEHDSNSTTRTDPSTTSRVSNLPDSQLKGLSTNDSTQTPSGGQESRRSSNQSTILSAKALAPAEVSMAAEASRDGGLASPDIAQTSYGDRCSIGEISVQPCAEFFRAPQCKAERPEEIASHRDNPENAEPSRSTKSPSLAQSGSIPLNTSQTTTNVAVASLFNSRVLAEDLGRELRLYYERKANGVKSNPSALTEN